MFAANNGRKMCNLYLVEEGIEYQVNHHLFSQLSTTQHSVKSKARAAHKPLIATYYKDIDALIEFEADNLIEFDDFLTLALIKVERHERIDAKIYDTQSGCSIQSRSDQSLLSKWLILLNVKKCRKEKDHCI